MDSCRKEAGLHATLWCGLVDPRKGARPPRVTTAGRCGDSPHSPPCSPSSVSDRLPSQPPPVHPDAPQSRPCNPGSLTQLSPSCLPRRDSSPFAMVTTTAPPPFRARISAGTEDPRWFPPSLLQRLMRADASGEGHQPTCCLVGPGGSPRPALKRVRRRKGKVRATSSSLSQSRYQQHQQHRAGLGRRSAAQGTRSLYEIPTAAPEPGLEAVPAEQAPTASPRAAAVSKPLRKELLKNKMGKSEKATIPYNQSVHSLHLCEQSKINIQRNKCNIQLNKIPPAKSENNCWQESVSSELIKNQEEKTLKNTENSKNMKSRKPIFLTEANQKENYAGAKFSEPPSPSVLPKPPSHWVGSTVQHSDQNREMMAVHLKTLLKVQA